MLYYAILCHNENTGRRARAREARGTGGRWPAALGGAGSRPHGCGPPYDDNNDNDNDSNDNDSDNGNDNVDNTNDTNDNIHHHHHHHYIYK